MNTPARLSLYGLGLVAAFGAAFLVSNAIVPDAAVDEVEAAAGGHGGHDEPAAEAASGEAALPGLSLEADGYRLSPVSAPTTTGEDGELAFSILNADGEPLVEYTEEHEQDLHLIVVRQDGSEFRHVHPELDADGVWSLPWTWEEGGTYRVFADFIPGDAESGITLTRAVDVAGHVEPVVLGDEVRSDETGGYDVELVGDLATGDSSTLTVEITEDGESVTTVQPYLGAFGHLVALRDGDLAYLHVHPEGAAPEDGELSGPTVDFATEAPTPGRYLLYFDFQIDGEVHTASFVLTAGDAGAAADDESGADTEPADEESEAPPADDGHGDDH